MTAPANLLRSYAQSILVYADETPLDHMPRLSERLSRTMLLKREDLQPIFSFKLRGAYNKIVRLPDVRRRFGVICASAGNHARGVALVARKLGIPATIVMPRTTPAIKVEAVRRLAGDVVLHGDTFDDAQTKAREIEAEARSTISPTAINQFGHATPQRSAYATSLTGLRASGPNFPCG
jgi:threonine dehydratase